MKTYLELVQLVLSEGVRKENRTGVDALSTFGLHHRHDMRSGFPLLTTKAVSWKSIVVENLWFLSGSRNIAFLRKHGCHFWDAWADSNGDVPSAYGDIWRSFPVHGPEVEEQIEGVCVRADYIDQIGWVIDELIRNPMSRRLVVSAWDPGNALSSKLPPCHFTFVLNVQNEKCLCLCHQPGNELILHDLKACCNRGTNQRLCLHLTQRSCDMALGVPYNIAGYAFLLELFSRFSGIQAGVFAHSLVDVHIYTAKPDGSMAEYDHVPGLKEQLDRSPKPSPRLHISGRIKSLEDVESLVANATTEELLDVFKLVNYNPWPKINFKVAV